ncbi:MAG: HD domain-containing protein [Clostridiales bacterium]|nr:HD domain-containing protein [Clostridiales bacterium]
MQRVQKIYRSDAFQHNLEENRKAEVDRRLCKHDMRHFLDVARLAYIFSLERGYEIPKEMIYATALLHDIGKHCQYKEGIPHEVASAKLAEPILIGAGFSELEKDEILAAISAHRSAEKMRESKSFLAEVIYDGDKKSRSCYDCEAKDECNWGDDKKNLNINW